MISLLLLFILTGSGITLTRPLKPEKSLFSNPFDNNVNLNEGNDGEFLHDLGTGTERAEGSGRQELAVSERIGPFPSHSKIKFGNQASYQTVVREFNDFAAAQLAKLHTNKERNPSDLASKVRKQLPVELLGDNSHKLRLKDVREEGSGEIGNIEILHELFGEDLFYMQK